MKRRDLLLGGIAAALAPVVARAQGRPVRIGWISWAPGQLVPSFHDGMRALGYREGSYLIEERYASDPRGLQAAINDLLQLPVDLFFAIGVPNMRAAAAATQSVPIVVIGNPIAAGVADSLARPGRNVTGVSLGADDFATKWLELMRELCPDLRRAIVLYDDGTARQADDMTAAGAKVGIGIVTRRARSAADIVAAIAEGNSAAGDVLVVPASSFFASNRAVLVAETARQRLPAIYEHQIYVERGGLISYGPDIRAVFQRAAYYVDRILKGAKPAELPIEEPTKFELTINLQTARALGLTVPQMIMLRADTVIE
jgi:putative tryptophan/tyrosine transport system substrate-binding protein